MDISFIILMVLFTVACTYINYKSGFKKGAESMLEFLELNGSIKFEKLENGQEIVKISKFTDHDSEVKELR
tara:strand:- start:1383 stop:1595 length:213 start_codon:yes stop_codon:yes gene_type:complete